MKARILFVINNLDRGGYEMRLLDLVKHCRDRLEFHICVLTAQASLLTEFQKYGVNITFIPIKRAYLEFGNALKIYKYTKQNKIGTLSSNNLKGLLTALIVKLFYLGKIIVVHNTVDLLHSYKYHHKLMLKFLLLFVDKSLCNSSSTREVLLNGLVNKNKVHIIYNGVDVENFKCDDRSRQSLRKQLGITSKDTIIGTVANFREEKNYPFLLEAFKRITYKRGDFKLICIGEGELFNLTKAMAVEMKIDGQILFTGYVDNVSDYMNIMDVFVLCSRKEGFPNALIQAMSIGLPIVATNVGGCAEIVNSGVDGYLFEPGDTDDFMDKVIGLAGNQSLCRKMGSIARDKIKSLYALPSMIDNYVSFYTDLYDRR